MQSGSLPSNERPARREEKLRADHPLSAEDRIVSVEDRIASVGTLRSVEGPTASVGLLNVGRTASGVPILSADRIPEAFGIEL